MGLADGASGRLGRVCCTRPLMESDTLLLTSGRGGIEDWLIGIDGAGFVSTPSDFGCALFTVGKDSDCIVS